MKIKTSDKTTIHYIEINGINKMHSWDTAAFIPQGNKQLAEYYIYGIKYNKEDWERLKSEYKEYTE